MNQISDRAGITSMLKYKPAPTLAKLQVGCGVHPWIKILTHIHTHRVGYVLNFGFTS
jgi:hypothetical protein